MTVHTILSYVYLDKIHKCYRKILVCKNKPKLDEPLNTIIKVISREKNSPYDHFYGCDSQPHCVNTILNPGNTGHFYGCDSQPHCVNTILNPGNTGEYLSADNIDILFNFFLENGYKIETQMTKLLLKTKTYKNKDIVCMISRN